MILAIDGPIRVAIGTRPLAPFVTELGRFFGTDVLANPRESGGPWEISGPRAFEPRQIESGRADGRPPRIELCRPRTIRLLAFRLTTSPMFVNLAVNVRRCVRAATPV